MKEAYERILEFTCDGIAGETFEKILKSSERKEMSGKNFETILGECLVVILGAIFGETHGVILERTHGEM